MITFHWWWMFLLLPLPLLIRKYAKPVPPTKALLLYTAPIDQHRNRRTLLRLLLITIWVLCITAAARPVWYGKPVTYNPKHHDMMLLLDLSGSMSMQDMKINGQYVDRLSAVKHVMTDFVHKREGDRLGLVLFADHAYLQAPLTFDTQAIDDNIQRTQLKMVGAKTAIGEGIALALKGYIKDDAKQRIIILLTDGKNTSGVINPLEAASMAKQTHTKIYVIGLGDNNVYGESMLNTDNLQQIADMTGGQYFHAVETQDLNKIYTAIDKLEPVKHAQKTWRPQKEWFPYPLGLALLLSIIMMFEARRYG